LRQSRPCPERLGPGSEKIGRWNPRGACRLRGRWGLKGKFRFRPQVGKSLPESTKDFLMIKWKCSWGRSQWMVFLSPWVSRNVLNARMLQRSRNRVLKGPRRALSRRFGVPCAKYHEREALAASAGAGSKWHLLLKRERHPRHIPSNCPRRTCIPGTR
jgi:hypothetical protein